MSLPVMERVEATARSRTALVLWAGTGVGLLASLLLAAKGQPSLSWPLARLLEVWAVVGLVGVLVGRRGFAELVSRGPGSARALLLVVMLGLGWAQYGIWTNETTYPFVDWGMYTAPTSQITYHDFLLLEDGEPTGALPISEVAPTRSPRALLSTLSSRAVDAADGDDDAREELEQAVAAIADLAELSSRGDALRVDSCKVTAPDGEGPSTACDELLTIELSDTGNTR